MSDPIPAGKNGMLIAEEVARLLRYDSTDHFLRVRGDLEADGFPKPIKRGRRLLWPVAALETWRAAQVAVSLGKPEAAQ